MVLGILWEGWRGVGGLGAGWVSLKREAYPDIPWLGGIFPMGVSLVGYWYLSVKTAFIDWTCCGNTGFQRSPNAQQTPMDHLLRTWRHFLHQFIQFHSRRLLAPFGHQLPTSCVLRRRSPGLYRARKVRRGLGRINLKAYIFYGTDWTSNLWGLAMAPPQDTFVDWIPIPTAFTLYI